MKEVKFKVIQHIRNMIVAIDKEMDNFPKKDIELKNRIRTNTYDALEIAYEANMLGNVEQKIQLIHKMLVKIKIIDFLLNLSYDKKLICEKNYTKLGNLLDDIAKYTNGWLKAYTDK